MSCETSGHGSAGCHDTDEGLSGLVSEATRLYEHRSEWLKFEALSPDERAMALCDKFAFSYRAPVSGWEEIVVTLGEKHDSCRASDVGQTVGEFIERVGALGACGDLWTSFALEPGGYSWHISRRFDLVYVSLELERGGLQGYLRWQDFVDALDPDWARERADRVRRWRGGREVARDADSLTEEELAEGASSLQLLRIPWANEELDHIREAVDELEATGIPQDRDWLCEDRCCGWEQLVVVLDGVEYTYEDYRADELVAVVDSLADGDDVIFCYGETPGPHDWFFARRGDVVYVDATFFEACFCFMTYDALRAAFDEA